MWHRERRHLPESRARARRRRQNGSVTCGGKDYGGYGGSGSEDFQRDKGGKGYGGSGNEDFHRDKGGKDYGGYGVVCFAKALKYINELRTSA